MPGEDQNLLHVHRVGLHGDPELHAGPILARLDQGGLMSALYRR
jgi:hypothetical protein